jgi:hypothetical protein
MPANNPGPPAIAVYQVRGNDGKTYTATDFSTLLQWASEGRVSPTTEIRREPKGAWQSASEQPGLFPAPPTVWRSHWGKWLFGVAVLFVPISLSSMIFGFPYLGDIHVPSKWQHPDINAVDLLIYAFWTLVPPAWLFLEYALIFPEYLKVNSAARDDIKYTQTLVAKFWSGLLLLFGVVLLVKYNIK